jgi:hypothetical protein
MLLPFEDAIGNVMRGVDRGRAVESRKGEMVALRLIVDAFAEGVEPTPPRSSRPTLSGRSG